MKEYDYYEDIDIIDILKDISNNKNTSEEELNNLQSYTKDYFSELYLLFDYDGHHPIRNKYEDRDEILIQLLSYFNNETENGKLLLSYPMVEALKEGCTNHHCIHNNLCHIPIDAGKRYKKIVSHRCKVSQYSELSLEHWQQIVKGFVYKLSCLFQKEDIDYKYYRYNINSLSIFLRQMKHYINDFNEIMIISAFPQFIIDYFGENICESYQCWY